MKIIPSQIEDVTLTPSTASGALSEIQSKGRGLREKVFTALSNSADNGFEPWAFTAQEVAADLEENCSECEGFPLEELTEHVMAYFEKRLDRKVAKELVEERMNIWNAIDDEAMEDVYRAVSALWEIDAKVLKEVHEEMKKAL